MRLLAIDTTSEACSVGVAAGGATIIRSEIVGRGHAEILMRLIEEAMTEARLAFADLDRIAVTVGPGSFTGLRIGIAAARGFALVTGKPAIGINTLAVHAEHARTLCGAHPVLSVLAAGRGEVYGAAFAAEGSQIEAPRAASPEVLAALLRDDMLVAGSGSDLVVAALPMDVIVRVAHRNASADIIAFCRLATAASSPTSAPRPLYLRPPDAKPQTAARIAHR
jgi:tRNA threonylcarbamoyladenosine biosynthesis protein TsaB